MSRLPPAVNIETESVRRSEPIFAVTSLCIIAGYIFALPRLQNRTRMDAHAARTLRCIVHGQERACHSPESGPDCRQRWFSSSPHCCPRARASFAWRAAPWSCGNVSVFSVFLWLSRPCLGRMNVVCTKLRKKAFSAPLVDERVSCRDGRRPGFEPARLGLGRSHRTPCPRCREYTSIFLLEGWQRP